MQIILGRAVQYVVHVRYITVRTVLYSTYSTYRRRTKRRMIGGTPLPFLLCRTAEWTVQDYSTVCLRRTLYRRRSQPPAIRIHHPCPLSSRTVLCFDSWLAWRLTLGTFLRCTPVALGVGGSRLVHCYSIAIDLLATALFSWGPGALGSRSR
jgi:hypothetical protein